MNNDTIVSKQQWLRFYKEGHSNWCIDSIKQTQQIRNTVHRLVYKNSVACAVSALIYRCLNKAILTFYWMPMSDVHCYHCSAS